MPSQATPRTTRACKACRALKVRCLPSEKGEICRKCARSGVECFFEEQRPRRKREKPDSRTRVAALERKLEEVIAQVSRSNEASQSTSVARNDNSSLSVGHSATHGSGTSQLGSTSSNSAHNTADSLKQLPTPESQPCDECVNHAPYTIDMHNGPQSTTNSAFSQFLSDGATPEVLISQGLLSIADVENHIKHFRQMCCYFPFVIIPREATVYTLLEERPMLFHAALAVSTSSEVYLQKVLEQSLKKIMLNRVVLEAEKSIDLLQSILICIGWGHFFHIPKRDQSYQLLQMAVGLCVDLGLDMTPSFAMQKIGLHLGHYQPSGDVEEDRFWSREARRAFLGCYHLSTMNNWIWAKPNTLGYSDYMLQCAKSISEAPEYATDDLVLPLIQLQQIGDEYHKILRVGRNESHSQGLLDRIGTHTRSFNKRIQDLRNGLTPAASKSTAVELAIHFAAVHTNEQDLLSPFTSISRMMATGAPMDPMSNSIDCPSRIDILVDCLQAAVEYLDFFLTIPLSSYSLLSTSQWSALIYSIVVMYRLSIGTPRVPLWDVQVARSTVKLERYLEILCDRMQHVSQERLRAIVETSKRDLYSVMGLIFQNVRNTYERLRRLPQEKSSTDEAIVHATSFPSQVMDEAPLPQPRSGPVFQQEQPRPGYQNRCPALQFWNKPQSPHASADNHMDLMGDDPYLCVTMLDEDGFWSQAFADMSRAEQANRSMDGVSGNT